MGSLVHADFHVLAFPRMHHKAPRRLSHCDRSGRWSGSCALFGGNNSEGNKKERKFITKEEEPQEYWQSAAEREGKGPMSTVQPYIVIFGFLTPFVILALGFVNGWIKVPAR